ncbi:hypothetical protein C4565_00600 [Candidatus Parcubacteria bacterium]|nr:MAG: hypothetical protein C4565_00600 [Candidatus Parcubacteria bacterium]
MAHDIASNFGTIVKMENRDNMTFVTVKSYFGGGLVEEPVSYNWENNWLKIHNIEIDHQLKSEERDKKVQEALVGKGCLIFYINGRSTLFPKQEDVRPVETFGEAKRTLQEAVHNTLAILETLK